MRHERRGFTLVELLVVIAIIGTLVGLLLPAVQAARESARNNTCKNNIKQLHLALTSFDSQRGKLPGYANELFNPNNKTQGRRASWIVMTFPYIEQSGLWDDWSSRFVESDGTTHHNPATPYLEILACPSNPPSSPGLPWCSYVGNAGQAFSDSTRTNNTEIAADGVFVDDNKNTSYGPTDSREGNARVQMSLAYISSNDGTSSTFMISENLHTWYWSYDTISGASGNVQPDTTSGVLDTKHAFGFVWKNVNSGSTQPADIERINGDSGYEKYAEPADMKHFSGTTPKPTDSPPCAYESYGFPSSNHPSGVNMAFCGGQIVFLSDSIDPLTYAQLMTTNRNKSSLVSSAGVAEKKLPPPSY